MLASLLSIYVGLLGLFVGSFLNVVVLRLKKGKSFVYGRSECPKCHKQLKWYELIPVISYVIQKGKCRGCYKPISVQYPTTEVITGLVLASLVLHFGLVTPMAIFSVAVWVVVACLLIIAAVYDARWMLLPDAVTLPAIFLAFVYVVTLSTLFDQNVLIPRLIAAMVFGVFFTTLWAVSSGKWLGDGDIRLAVIMSLMLNFQQLIVGVFFSFNIAAVVSIGLLLNHKKSRRDAIALGPFLILGTYLGLIFGEKLLSLYLGQ